jgi:hypothetical protein
MNQLLESLRRNSSLRYKKILCFISLQISRVLPKISYALSRELSSLQISRVLPKISYALSRELSSLQISRVLPKISYSLSRGLSWIYYYVGFGTALATLAAFIILLSVVAQTKSLKEQVKLTEESLKLVDRQTQISLAITRPFAYILPSKNKNLTEWGYNIINTGDVPARIIANNVKVQAGNQSWKVGSNTEAYIVSKDDSKIILRMAACIVYKSVDDDDPRKWIAMSGDVYDSHFGKFTMKFRDVQNASPDTKTCSVELP